MTWYAIYKLYYYIDDLQDAQDLKDVRELLNQSATFAIKADIAVINVQQKIPARSLLTDA
jgi:hypothetical protein